jgi:hypothetical protein
VRLHPALLDLGGHGAAHGLGAADARVAGQLSGGAGDELDGGVGVEAPSMRTPNALTMFLSKFWSLRSDAPPRPITCKVASRNSAAWAGDIDPSAAITPALVSHCADGPASLSRLFAAWNA